MVRLQCKYCHHQHDYGDGPMDQDQLNHFNDNSFTREQFRDHACFKEQQRIDEKMQGDESYAQIKMLLLQNSKSIIQKGELKCSKEFVCKNSKCAQGWFNTPPPNNIFSSTFQNFNANQERMQNKSDHSCQLCKKVYDESDQISSSDEILERCQKCCQGQCKFCLVVDHRIPSRPSCDQNDIVLRSILNILEIKQGDIGLESKFASPLQLQNPEQESQIQSGAV